MGALRHAQCRGRRRYLEKHRRGGQIREPDIKKLVDPEGNYGEQLRLTKDWVVRIVKHVGNYGEVFERNVGEDSPLKIKRGLNALWTKGGLQYAPPIR